MTGSREKKINITANRLAQKWSRSELIRRVLWGFAECFFAWSPRLMHGWRCKLLRMFGAKIGKGLYILPSVRVTIPWNLDIGDDVAIGEGVIMYALGPISIGARTTISQGAHLCAGTHDWRDPAMPLIKLPIVIKADVWVCADVFVGPGVTVGQGAICGARAVVVKDVEAGAIVGGNPARVIGRRDG